MTVKTSISLEEETLSKLKAVAEREGRSVSNLVNFWLETSFKAKEAQALTSIVSDDEPASLVAED